MLSELRGFDLTGGFGLLGYGPARAEAREAAGVPR
jgi:hypothetical protein